jgi:hypothetical protein
MGLKVVVVYATLYAALCWIALSCVPALEIGPEIFLALFVITLALGFLLIVMQVNENIGDSGGQIVMLSGKIIPGVTINPEREKEEQQLQIWVERGKFNFFFLSIFILVFWVHLSIRGFPKEWWDKGYSFLIFMYSFGKAGQEFSNGNGLRAILSLFYIKYPYLLSLPYALFIYWVLKGRQLFSEFVDDD